MTTTDIVPWTPPRSNRKQRRVNQARPVLLAAARKGATDTDAAAAARIGIRTLYRWLTDPELADLASDYDYQKALARIESIGRIREAGSKGDWRADAWYLSRADREHWADKAPVDPDAAIESLAQKLSLLLG